jgi:glycosyltransferase involved in cell wall biosynthesis
VAIRDIRAIDAQAKLARRIGARLVYDLDDYLLGMEDHPEKTVYMPMVAAVRASLAAADRVWCSTGRLASLVEGETAASIEVMPNMLDPEVWELHEPRPARPHDPSLRVLYMGTRTHDEDFAFLAKVMERLHRRQPGLVQLHMIGVRTDDAQSAPWLRVHAIPGYVGASYPAFVHWLVRQPAFDLGVAPLVETAFNAGKSPIKVLDYAALGIPALASRVPAYAGSLRDGIDCMLADNRVDAWEQALLTLAADAGLRASLLSTAASLVAPDVFEAGWRRRLDDMTVAQSPSADAALLAEGGPGGSTTSSTAVRRA